MNYGYQSIVGYLENVKAFVTFTQPELHCSINFNFFYINRCILNAFSSYCKREQMLFEN